MSSAHLFLYDPQPQPEDKLFIRYRAWLNIQRHKMTSADSMYYYLRKLCLSISDRDPTDLPGLCHAMNLIADQGTLDKKQMSELMQCMTKIYAEHRLRGLFLIGNTVGCGWKVVAKISEADGFFNRGIYICDDTTRKHKSRGVLKVLPAWSEYPGYGEREIHLLNRVVDLPNVVQLRDCHEPEDRDAAPWIITDFCNGGTLQVFDYDKIERNICVPELFLWHVFESLLTAAHACHTGPTDRHAGTWDPIYHRDIIEGNIFLTSSDTPNESYPTVTLADFGCAISRSELEEHGFKPKDLPEVCPSTIAPEGPVASAAFDVWQIGVTVQRVAAVTRYRHFDHKTAKLFMDVKALGKYLAESSGGYMLEFRQLLDACLAIDPRDRPTAGELLREVRKRRAELMGSGALKFEPLGG